MGTLKSNQWIWSAAVAAIGAAAALCGAAQAADVGPYTPPVETWTGFSLGVGGGIAFLDADVNSKASRRDEVGQCVSETIHFDSRDEVNSNDFIDVPCDPAFAINPILDLTQSAVFNIDDLSDTGGFVTVQGAYDYQFAPRWVAGVFVDADWYDLSADARQTHAFSQTIVVPDQCPGGICPAQLNGNRNINLKSVTTIDALISPEWSISVGGRAGWLATPNTLLYFLAAYTHTELDDARVNVGITDALKGLNTGTFTGDIVFGENFRNSPTSLLVKLPDSLDGFSLGGGGEVKLGGPWALKGEYRWTHLDGGSGRASSSHFESSPTLIKCLINEGAECSALLDFREAKSQASADFDLDIHTVRAVLTYHFWTGRGYGG